MEIIVSEVRSARDIKYFFRSIHQAVNILLSMVGNDFLSTELNLQTLRCQVVFFIKVKTLMLQNIMGTIPHHNYRCKY